MQENVDTMVDSELCLEKQISPVVEIVSVSKTTFPNSSQFGLSMIMKK